MTVQELRSPDTTVPPSSEISCGCEIEWDNVGITGSRYKTSHGVFCEVGIGMNRGTRRQLVTNCLVLFRCSMKYQSCHIVWIAIQHYFC